MSVCAIQSVQQERIGLQQRTRLVCQCHTLVCKIIIALRLLNRLMPTIVICLTRSGTGCFIAQPIWQQWASKS